MNFLYITAGMFLGIFEENRHLRGALAQERADLAEIREQRDTYDRERRRLLDRVSQMTVLLHQCGINVMERSTGEVVLTKLGADSSDDALETDGDDAVE